MATIAEMLMALQAKEDYLNSQLKAIEEKKAARREKNREHNLERNREQKRKAYAVKRAALLADPAYVPKRCGRPPKKVEEPQAVIV